MLLLAWLFSTDRRAIRWRTVIWGLGLQIAFAFLVVEWTVGESILATVSGAITHMLNYSFAGSQMVFGELGKQHSS
jgi:CNT family concentrative nucleoside transporter